MYKINGKKIKPEIKILELLPFVLLPVIWAKTVTFWPLLFILFSVCPMCSYVSGPITPKKIEFIYDMRWDEGCTHICLINL